MKRKNKITITMAADANARSFAEYSKRRAEAHGYKVVVYDLGGGFGIPIEKKYD